MTSISLREVDRVEILTLLDNTIDLLLPSTETVKRLPLPPDALTRDPPVAEHGFAALVVVHAPEGTQSLLFDAGLSRDGLAHNLDVLQIPPEEIELIVLSHGHADHTQGLMGLVDRLEGRKVRLLLHPDAFLRRKVAFPDGSELSLPALNRCFLSQEGIEFVVERQASCVLGGAALVSGEIRRSTKFETGFPLHQAFIDGAWQPDPLIHDDQALILNLRGKGLVVLTGCGHAGLINTVRHAQALTGVRRIHAVIGGFHLSGRIFEPIIPPTLAALKEIAPDTIVPAHCTGWQATHAIAREFPEAFIQNSVGTCFLFSSDRAAAS